MEEEIHLLSNHADIEAIITAIEHFLHVESFPGKQKICLKTPVYGKELVFAILPTGFGESLIFQLIP